MMGAWGWRMGIDGVGVGVDIGGRRPVRCGGYAKMVVWR